MVQLWKLNLHNFFLEQHMERSTATRGRWGYVNMSRENHWYSFGLGQRWGPVLTDRDVFFIKCVLVLDQGFLSKQFWSIPEWRTPDYFPPMKNTQDEPPSRTALVKASAKKQPLDLPAPEGTLFLPKIKLFESLKTTDDTAVERITVNHSPSVPSNQRFGRFTLW